MAGQLFAFDIREPKVLFLPEDSYTGQENSGGDKDRNHQHRSFRVVRILRAVGPGHRRFPSIVHH